MGKNLHNVSKFCHQSSMCSRETTDAFYRWALSSRIPKTRLHRLTLLARFDRPPSGSGLAPRLPPSPTSIKAQPERYT